MAAGRATSCAGSTSRSTPGERVALMGRNGAGKTTLLRAAAGLVEPARGRISAPRGCALLAQSPGDLLVRERVADELPGEAGARGPCLGRAGVGGGGRSARSVRRRAPAPGAGAGDGGPGGGRTAPRARRPRRADAGDGPGAQGGARRLGRRAGATGRERRGRHARRRVRVGVRGARRAARGRRADRRRPGRGDPLRRLVLRHRGGPHPRRRRHNLSGAGRRAPAERVGAKAGGGGGGSPAAAQPKACRRGWSR